MVALGKEERLREGCNVRTWDLSTRSQLEVTQRLLEVEQISHESREASTPTQRTKQEGRPQRFWNQSTWLTSRLGRGG